MPDMTLPTVTKIFESYAKKSKDWRRNHCGASGIGKDCAREIWYNFRWCTEPEPEGRMFRIFDHGNIEETRVLNDLKNIGVEIYDRDPENGKQISYQEDNNKHFAGSVDAIGKGFEESSVFHVVEIKSINQKGFQDVCKKGIEQARPVYYAQAQIYMRWSGLERAFFFVTNKNTDEIYGERINYDKAFAENLVKKAEYIVFSDNPPERLYNAGKNTFSCRFCEHKEVCHEGKLPEISCRTCAFADPMRDGTWTCTRTKKTIGPDEQRAACEFHVFIPSMVPLIQVDARPDACQIVYQDGIINGIGAIASKDLENHIPKEKRLI